MDMIHEMSTFTYGEAGILIDLKSNPLKRSQSAANDVECVDAAGFSMCQFLHLVSRIHSTRRLTYNSVSIALCVIRVELTALYCSVYEQVPN